MSYNVAQSDLELMTNLPPKYQDDRDMLCSLASDLVLFMDTLVLCKD